MESRELIENVFFIRRKSVDMITIDTSQLNLASAFSVAIYEKFSSDVDLIFLYLSLSLKLKENILNGGIFLSVVLRDIHSVSVINLKVCQQLSRSYTTEHRQKKSTGQLHFIVHNKNITSADRSHSNDRTSQSSGANKLLSAFSTTLVSMSRPGKYSGRVDSNDPQEYEISGTEFKPTTLPMYAGI